MVRKLINDMISPEINKSSPRIDIPFGNNKKPGGDILKSLSTILLGAIVIFGLFFFLTSYFSSAEVFITAVRQTSSLDNLVSLSKDKNDAGKIKYSLMKLEGIETANVLASGSKSVSIFSKGKTILYNTFGPSSQKLAKGTRLETADGKIYKIDSAVTIPGAKGIGANLVPGQIAVSITASLPGANYNVSSVSFTIPGFKGTAKYSKVYAKSSGDIVGGFTGSTKVVSPADINKARATLSEDIKQKLLRKAIAQVPDGYIFFDGTYSLSLKDNAINNAYLSSGADDSAQYKLSGVLSAIIVDEKSLNSYILSDKFSVTDDSTILLRGGDKLSMTILNKDKIELGSVSVLTARIVGPVELIWNFDQKLLSGKLAGVKKSDYQAIFIGFPGVKKAIAKFSPSWAWSFPDDTRKITIIKDFEQDADK